MKQKLLQAEVGCEKKKVIEFMKKFMNSFFDKLK